MNYQTMEYTSEDLLFFDIEVFRFDSLVVFKDVNSQTVGYFWNDDLDERNGFGALADFIRGKLLVGFNNHEYDDKILKAMLGGNDSGYIKSLNDYIITGGSRSSRPVETTKYCKYSFPSLDTADPIGRMKSTERGRSGRLRMSLKDIENKLGRSIIETSVPFDITRPLTPRERRETLKYCEADVDTTVEVFKLTHAGYKATGRDDYFQAHSELITMVPEERRPDLFQRNNEQIAAEIVTGGIPRTPWQTLNIGVARNTDHLPPEVWDLWKHAETEPVTCAELNVPLMQMFGCDIQFSWGGLHGVATGQTVFNDVIILDVASMYPSIAVQIRALDDRTEIYDQMRRERISIKKSDPVRAAALKLILNSVYGKLGQNGKTNPLYNIRAARSICIYGQCAAFDLTRRLYEAGYQPININTDGVAFTDPSGAGDKWKEVQRDWEAVYGISLEPDFFDRFIAKDVNNYLGVHEIAKGSEPGNLKAGGDMKRYLKELPLKPEASPRIVKLAVTDFLLYGIPTRETIEKHLDDLSLYAVALKTRSVKKLPSEAVDEEGNRYGKVNRVFAVRDVPGALYLQMMNANGDVQKFPKAPGKVYIWNHDLGELPDIREFLDLDYYEQFAADSLKNWKV